jgi:hypothetical protein
MPTPPPPPSNIDAAASQAPRKTADLPAYRRAYWQGYKARQKRVNVLVTHDEHERLTSAAQNAAVSVPAVVKALAFARLDETPPASSADKEQLDEVIFLLRNLANNTNQIARRLNQEAMEHRPIGLAESTTILETLFAEWRALEGKARAAFPAPSL